jgi:outer membrane receptor protein involved in Fe transport
MTLLGALEFEANYFDIRTADRIVWTPDVSGLWTPRNLQDVRSNGIELIGSWRLVDDRIVLRASYTNSDTRRTRSSFADDQTVNRQLPFLPHETAGISCAGTVGRITATVHHGYSGFRYSTESNDPKFVLPGYGKTDANLSIRLADQPFSASLRCEVSNIFNTPYELFPNYPMPLRTFALKVLVDY